MKGGDRGSEAGWKGPGDISLRAQETLWWDLKCKHCDVSVGLSSKTLTYPGAITPSSSNWPPGGPANALSLYFLFCSVLTFKKIKA